MADRASQLHLIFHALADPTRRKILERLRAGPLSVSQLASPFNMTLAAVVQHLQVLEESGLATTEKAGRVRTCCINPRGIELAKVWLETLKTPWEERFDRLGELLNEKTVTRKKTQS